MTAVDKAAIAWTIAIVAVGVAIAGAGDQLQGSPSPQAQYAEREAAMEKSSESMQKMEESMEKQKEMIEPKAMEEPEPEVMEEPEPEVMEEPEPEVMSGPKTVTVRIPVGTAVPGCEETNECYIPASVSINVGDTVSWPNDDTAAHTVTAGSAESGPSGAFDSSLLIAGGVYEHTFDSAGSYDYYCMVHPWMVGDVQVS